MKPLNLLDTQAGCDIFEMGYREGYQKGFKQGLEEGSHRITRLHAQAMLQLNFKIAMIMQITDLSEQEIKALQKNST